MKRILIASALASALLGSGGLFTSATAQSGSQIDIAYIEPGNAAFRPIYDRLKARQVLEDLREFLSPLKLTRRVLVKLEQCNQPAKDYEPGGAVTICYEYVAQLEQLASKIPADGKTARGVSREDAVVGAFVQITLHEMAHAVFDVFQLPVWGREEDAADKLAGYLMLQFGVDNARKALNGAAYFFEASGHTWTGNDFADVYSTESQRFYNYLCIAYGGNQNAFKDFVMDDGTGKTTSTTKSNNPARLDLLPSRRAARCPKEYNDVSYAFNLTIMPNIDQDLMMKVLARKDWLRPAP